MEAKRINFSERFLNTFVDRKTSVYEKYIELLDNMLNCSEARQQAVLMTRQEKKDIDMHKLFEDWEIKLLYNSVDFLEELKKVSVDKKIVKQKATAIDAVFVEQVLKEEKKIYFSEKDVERILFSYNKEISDEFLEAFKQKFEGFESKFFRGIQSFYVKSEAQQFLRIFNYLSDMKKTKVKEKDITYKESEVEKLTEQQKVAFKSICNKYLTLIQGYAGVGKSKIFDF